jgi:hypothetical protein
VGFIFFSDSQDEARKHFNCPVLEGMELENQGGMGTELNHWEKRLLEVSVFLNFTALFFLVNIIHAHSKRYFNGL